MRHSGGAPLAFPVIRARLGRAAARRAGAAQFGIYDSRYGQGAGEGNTLFTGSLGG
jgi:hypothetical protein